MIRVLLGLTHLVQRSFSLDFPILPAKVGFTHLLEFLVGQKGIQILRRTVLNSSSVTLRKSPTSKGFTL